MPPTTADPLRRDQPAAGPSAEATTSARSKTWAGVVTGFTAADLERVRAFSARRLATRVVGTELHVFVVLPDKASAAVVGRSMGITATWQKADGSSWGTIQSTHDVVVDAAHQGKRLREGESQQPLPRPALDPSPDPERAARARAGLASLLQQIHANDPTAAQDVLQDPLTENIFRDLGPLRATREPMGSPPSRSKPVPPPSSPSLDEEHAEEPQDSAGEPMDVAVTPPSSPSHDESEELPDESPPSLEWLLGQGLPFSKESLVGKPVQLRGLEKRPELNGEWGRIITMPASPTARVPVSLDDSQQLLLKPANVHIARSDSSKSREGTRVPPEDARADLDYQNWLKREALLHPHLQEQLNLEPPGPGKSLLRRCKERGWNDSGTTQKSPLSDADYIRNFGYLHGVGEEPDEAMQHPDIWPTTYTIEDPATGEVRREIWDGKGGKPGNSFWRTDFVDNEVEGEDEAHWSSGGDESEEEASVEANSSADIEADFAELAVAPRRWPARACDTCLRCGKLGHWASACTELQCGNCKQIGHRAADCPKPAPCFRCGKLGHWVKDCPEAYSWQQRPATTKETGPMQLEEPTVGLSEFIQPVRTYLHFCTACEYRTSVLTKAARGIPRHKVRRQDGWTSWMADWCSGSGDRPSHSELVDEREPEGSGICVCDATVCVCGKPILAIGGPSTHEGSVAANSTDLIYRMPHLF